MSSRYPTYSDLGKDCRDLFSKGYHFGLFKINVKNSTCHGMEITTNGTHKIEDKSGKGEVQFKNTYPYKGLASLHKWDTDNVMNHEISLQDAFPGGKVALNMTVNTDSGNKGGKVSLQYKHPSYTIDTKLDGADDTNMMVGGSIVTGHKGLLGAYKFDYDTNEGILKANNAGLGYQKSNHGFWLLFNNFAVVNGLYHRKINREMEVGAECKIGEEGGPFFAVAGRFLFNGSGHHIRAKVDTNSMLGLGLEVRIMPGFVGFASGNIDMKNFAAGNHKVGFGLEFGM